MKHLHKKSKDKICIRRWKEKSRIMLKFLYILTWKNIPLSEKNIFFLEQQTSWSFRLRFFSLGTIFFFSFFLYSSCTHKCVLWPSFYLSVSSIYYMIPVLFFCFLFSFVHSYIRRQNSQFSFGHKIFSPIIFDVFSFWRKQKYFIWCELFENREKVFLPYSVILSSPIQIENIFSEGSG